MRALVRMGRIDGFGPPSPWRISRRRVVESGVAPVINTGIAHRQAGVGQIGAGIARAPLGPFAAGLRAVAERLQRLTAEG